MTPEVYRGIWVVGEQSEGNLRPVTLEMLTVGRRLANSLRQELTAVMMGRDLDRIARRLVDFGPDSILLMSAEELRFFSPETYADALSGLCAQRKPLAILLPATYNGRDLAPRLAAKLGVGLAADCVNVQLEDGILKAVRPVYGGNFLATMIQPSSKPQLVTLRPRTLKPARPDKPVSSSVEHVNPRFSRDPFNKLVLRSVREVCEESENLDQSEVVIGIGRGLGKAENIRMINQLADALHAAVGGSRSVIDAGWLPPNQQIGLTGRLISPRMYIALGVSGAIQHLVGVRSAREIVAINKDPEAPIFKVATFGIVGDIFTVVPALLAEIREKQRQK